MVFTSVREASGVSQIGVSTCSTLTQNTDTNCTEKRAGAQQVQDTSDDIPLQTLDDEDCTWPQRRTAENLKPQSSAPASSNSPRTVESWRSRAETSKLRRHLAAEHSKVHRCYKKWLTARRRPPMPALWEVRDLRLRGTLTLLL